MRYNGLRKWFRKARKQSRTVTCGLVVCMALLAPLSVSAADVTVDLGPEINAGGTAGGNQYQSDLRVNPLDLKNYCITTKNSTDETKTVLLHTADGGASWSSVPMTNTGDPDVVYDLSGNAHWMFIDKANSKRLGYRKSTDGGKTWGTKVVMDSALDHPHIACDMNPSSPYKGSIYIAGRNFSGEKVTIYRSRDAGLTWSKTVLSPGTQLGLGFVFNLVILSDGTLIVPMRTKNNILAVDGYYAGNEVDLYCLRSTDGGVNFDQPILVSPKDSPAKSGPGGFYGMSAGVGKYNGKDRLYISFVKNFPSPKPCGLMLTNSDDGGKTWSTPRQIVGPTASDWGAGSCSVMVNRDGVIGIQFYSIYKGDSKFDVFFTASADGGQNFTTPVRITSGPMIEPAPQPRYFGQDQVYGDTDKDGKFHVVWTDARNNATQYTIYTRVITVNGTLEPVNSAPVIESIYADPSSVTLPEKTTLGVIASDADMDKLSVNWSKTAGPGSVSFTSPGSDVTSVSFSVPGEYVFKATVSDGEISISDEVIVTVNAAPVPANGLGITREVWFDITGTSVTNLTNSSRYPMQPDLREIRSSFEAPTKIGDYYGTRMHGYLLAPVTGDYTLWIAGDDNCELWLSTDESTSQAKKIAYIAGWTSSREWTKYSSQRSAAIRLVAGQRYYIMALQKEHSGGDCLAVAWQGPGLNQQVIDGSYLFPYNETVSDLSVELNGVLSSHDVEVYAGSQNTVGTALVEDNGSTLHITGNLWRKVNLGSVTVTKNTVLEFDFASSAQGEIHGIGFDNDDGVSSDLTFQVYGTQGWGITKFRDYVALSVKHYVIPVGQYYTGTFSHLMFVNDHDVTSPTGDSVFSNIRIYEQAVASPIGETGTVKAAQASSTEWHKVTFRNSYTNPVVVMGPPSYEGSDPSSIRVRNVTTTSFEWQLDEYDYLDGKHGEETVGYMVVEAGSYRLADGSLLQAGKAQVTAQFTGITFPVAFASTPVSLTQTITVNDGSAVVTRQTQDGPTGFQVCLQNQESRASTPHSTETVAWISFSAGATDFGGLKTSVSPLTTEIDHEWAAVRFSESFSVAPVVLSSMQSTLGGDTSALRMKSFATGSVSIMIEEETSKDTEVWHKKETIGLVAVEAGDIAGSEVNVIK
ncbi:MAG: hypothetical protein JXR97_10435 [Planctomycetes bacterium]|nr:hypothetical protein [Planctomycetota bacterium]